MKTLSVLWIYCFVLLVGGIIGFAIGGSLASLNSSLGSATILLSLSYFVAKRKKIALISTIGYLALLDIFFIYRWLVVGSNAAGIMSFFSLLTLLGFALAARKEYSVLDTRR